MLISAFRILCCTILLVFSNMDVFCIGSTNFWKRSWSTCASKLIKNCHIWGKLFLFHDSWLTFLWAPVCVGDVCGLHAAFPVCGLVSGRPIAFRVFEACVRSTGSLVLSGYGLPSTHSSVPAVSLLNPGSYRFLFFKVPFEWWWIYFI